MSQSDMTEEEKFQPLDEPTAPDLLSFENNQQLINMLRFLINDQAFSTDFLITAISEYVISNHKTKEPSDGD